VEVASKCDIKLRWSAPRDKERSILFNPLRWNEARLGGTTCHPFPAIIEVVSFSIVKLYRRRYISFSRATPTGKASLLFCKYFVARLTGILSSDICPTLKEKGRRSPRTFPSHLRPRIQRSFDLLSANTFVIGTFLIRLPPRLIWQLHRAICQTTVHE